MSKDGYIEYVKDCMKGVSGLSFRRMFGEWGVYHDGRIFAIVADDQLYFKRGEVNAADFDEYRSKPFTYTGHNGKPYAMSYWEVPEEVMENGQLLQEWIRKAAAVVRQVKKQKRKKPILTRQRRVSEGISNNQ